MPGKSFFPHQFKPSNIEPAKHTCFSCAYMNQIIQHRSKLIINLLKNKHKKFQRTTAFEIDDNENNEIINDNENNEMINDNENNEMINDNENNEKIKPSLQNTVIKNGN